MKSKGVSGSSSLYFEKASLNMAAIILNTVLKPLRWLFFPDHDASNAGK